MRQRTATLCVAVIQLCQPSRDAERWRQPQHHRLRPSLNRKPVFLDGWIQTKPFENLTDDILCPRPAGDEQQRHYRGTIPLRPCHEPCSDSGRNRRVANSWWKSLRRRSAIAAA
ncbi:hypothetical protein EV652_113193 [Kribbella steppae]|uniref:Uncharacterized protein n=1 Tax=Kribbella steppae TaxID=2512223 RepID=A0A4R2H3S3_9ACTN|nr:hypothetical protein EV652_113193 [Kribbella steppae]